MYLPDKSTLMFVIASRSKFQLLSMLQNSRRTLGTMRGEYISSLNREPEVGPLVSDRIVDSQSVRGHPGRCVYPHLAPQRVGWRGTGAEAVGGWLGGQGGGADRVCLEMTGPQSLRLHASPKPLRYTFDCVAGAELTQEALYNSAPPPPPPHNSPSFAVM